MNPELLQQAVDFAIASESTAPRDLEVAHALSWNTEPFDEAIGPLKVRGPQSGIVVKDGYIVAEWGETRRVDPTFSVAKSFLSSTVGLAWDRGLIRDVDDPVHEYMPPLILPVGDGEPGSEADGRGVPTPVSLFDSEHNRRITWDHLLRQTSDWEGTLWGKPDWGDRPGRDVAANRNRARNAPGTAYKYNDVRVNLLALAALQVWRRPLPQVLREHIMDPIGASNTWRWYGYENSWVNVDGEMMQSVSGGTHWGGGMNLSAEDQARFGYFTAAQGQLGRRAAPFRGMAGHGGDAGHGQRDVRVHELLPEHRPAFVREHAGVVVQPPGGGDQPGLRRSRERPGGGRALDPGRRHRRVPGDGDRFVGRRRGAPLKRGEAPAGGGVQENGASRMTSG